nr:probable U3 small nucleolar RNA-associated protein 11 [Onthophagus taurus]
MSVWKKASKANRKTYRERHQPESRSHLGLLEKKKDYKQRAVDHNEKDATLKLLRKRALNKNPDEFYHHMINSKIENGIHFEKETRDEDTPEQIQLMSTQDLKYVVTKRTQELKKIEKLQSRLHLCNVDHEIKNNHKYFKENLDESYNKEDKLKLLGEVELPDVNLEVLGEAVKNRKGVYKELAKRIHRERELSIIQRKLEMKRCVDAKKNVLPPKKLKKGDKESAPVYVWKYERKK